MICRESEYRRTLKRLDSLRQHIEVQRQRLGEQEVSEDKIAWALSSSRAMYEQLSEDVELYERCKRGELWELVNLEGLGRLLVALRISKGISQSQLAKRLGVGITQITRGETNEYRNITLSRATRILKALQVELRGAVDMRNNSELNVGI